MEYAWEALGVIVFVGFIAYVLLYPHFAHQPRPGGTEMCPTHANPYSDNECVYQEPDKP